MESTRQFAPKAWQWLNILSLDAPIIAVAWQALLKHSLGVRVNRLEPLVLALSVWLVYVADQLLDALKPAAGNWEPARKMFYRRYFRLAASLWVVAGAAILPLAYLLLRPATFFGGLELAVGVFLYFAAVHATPHRWRGLWPREAAVASLFALGTFLGVWSADGKKIELLVAPTLLFALLCWANCAAIETWEWQGTEAPADPPPGASTRWATRHLGYAGVAVLLAALAARLAGVATVEFAAACALSGAGLSLLWLYRSRLPPDSVSAAANLTLCSPLFGFAFSLVARLGAMNCDTIARWYRWGEYLVLGKTLERRRREYLQEAARARRVLLLGDGDGRFTAELAALNPRVEADSLDLSHNMLRLAAKRLAALPFPSPGVQLHQADALSFPLKGRYDLIVTHFFLDCLSDQQAQALAGKIAQAAQPGAFWIVSEFRTPNWAAALFVKALYLAFSLLTGSKVYRLPDYARALRQHGFQRMAHRTALGGLLVSELWKLA